MKHWWIYLIGAIAALSWEGSYVFAANVNVEDGHILERIELRAEGENFVLTLHGSFSAALLPDLQIRSGQDEVSTLIEIPYGFVNNLTLPRSLSFRSSDALSRIQVEEQVRQNAQGEVFAQVNLLVTARRPLAFEFQPNQATARSISFLLINKAGGLDTQSPLDLSPAPTSPRPDTLNTQRPLSTLNTQRPSGQMPSQSPTTQGSSESMLPPMTASMSEVDRVLLHPVSAMMVFQRPSKVRVSILNASPRQDAAQRLAILLDRHQRRRLETRLHMKMDIANISSVREQTLLPKTKIYFRPNYLASALAFAEIIPGEQVVEQMSIDALGRLGIDIDIYVGANFE